MKVVTIQQSIMAEDEKYAARIRSAIREKKILMVNIIGSPGSGKTTLLEATADALSLSGGEPLFSFSVIEGDLETTRDADRLAAKNIKTVQINTKGGCHLEAHIVERAFDSLGIDSLDVIFIENVGNLVCPAEFDLGEDFKIAVLSVPEGADKPLKYPMLFSQAKAIVLTKTDLLPYVSFDSEMFKRDVHSLNPDAPVFPLNLTSGEGVAEWVNFVACQLKGKRENV